MKVIRGMFLTALLMMTPFVALKAASAPERNLGGPARAGDLGVGAQLGVPIGVSLKYWMDNRLAIQGTLGTWSSEFTATADIVWHDPNAFKSAGSNDAPGFYLGGGLYISGDDDDELGIRGLAGLNYFFPDNPFEVYAELAPTLILEDDTEGDLTGGVGGRYYFR